MLMALPGRAVAGRVKTGRQEAGTTIARRVGASSRRGEEKIGDAGSRRRNRATIGSTDAASGAGERHGRALVGVFVEGRGRGREAGPFSFFMLRLARPFDRPMKEHPGDDRP